MNEIITSTQNKTIKERTKLHLKKERDRQSRFIVEGLHLVEEACQAQILQELYLLEGLKNPLPGQPVTYCTQSVMQKLSNQVSQATMIGICRKKKILPPCINTALFLDTVQDPGNVGTLFRSAYSFGIDIIYLSNDCADIYSTKSLQSSQGSIFHIPFAYVDLMDQIRTSQSCGMHMYATALHTASKPLQSIVPPLSYGLLIGNEGKGVKSELIAICNETIQIETTAFESLNAAVAGSIIMYTLQKKTG